MIQELIANKEKYLWSRSTDNTIIVGGNDQGLSYGKIEFVLGDTSIIVRKQVTDGVSSGEQLIEQIIEKENPVFDLIQNFSKILDDYLKQPLTILDYSVKRQKLLQNTSDLLQKKL